MNLQKLEPPSYTSKCMQESLPLAELPQIFSNCAEYLKFLVQDGLKKRYGESFSDEIQQRANAELETIISCGWENYFLLVAEIASWCKSQNIAWGLGRGSAPSSIVNYALGITDVEPAVINSNLQIFLDIKSNLFSSVLIQIDEYFDIVLLNTFYRTGFVELSPKILEIKKIESKADFFPAVEKILQENNILLNFLSEYEHYAENTKISWQTAYFFAYFPDESKKLFIQQKITGLKELFKSNGFSKKV